MGYTFYGLYDISFLLSTLFLGERGTDVVVLKKQMKNRKAQYKMLDVQSYFGSDLSSP